METGQLLAAGDKVNLETKKGKVIGIQRDVNYLIEFDEELSVKVPIIEKKIKEPIQLQIYLKIGCRLSRLEWFFPLFLNVSTHCNQGLNSLIFPPSKGIFRERIRLEDMDPSLFL